MFCNKLVNKLIVLSGTNVLMASFDRHGQCALFLLRDKFVDVI